MSLVPVTSETVRFFALKVLLPSPSFLSQYAVLYLIKVDKNNVPVK